MFLKIILCSLLSVTFIMIIHYLYYFFINMFTIPKVKDLFNKPTTRYNNIINQPLNDNNQSLNDNNQNQSFNMQYELKNFLNDIKKNKSNDNLNESNFNNTDVFNNTSNYYSI